MTDNAPEELRRRAELLFIAAHQGGEDAHGPNRSEARALVEQAGELGVQELHDRIGEVAALVDECRLDGEGPGLNVSVRIGSIELSYGAYMGRYRDRDLMKQDGGLDDFLSYLRELALEGDDPDLVEA